MAFHELIGGSYGKQFLGGVQFTLLLASASWLLAMIVGVALAAVRKLGGVWSERFVSVYVAYHRNVPMLVHVLLWYFGISNLLPLAWQDWTLDHNGELIFAAIAIGLCSSAYFAEDIRSGIRAVAPGQIEAARSVGFGSVSSMVYIILPQAFRAALPTLVNNTVVLFKNTSMAMAIGVAELTYVTKEIENATFLTFPTYAVATLFYIGGSLCIMLVGEHIARKLQSRGG
ncbi:amino acid ABC transporter permease [Candidimonas sp. SYP-B2681]|uniref:amino acid ABC transporter permease n=1 Tax=Candidimonas sp. SYP-B2681 TaxID=2497686 RepID=UPI000F889D33|nr:amino acid ABC transporter permease [Candidimonas sp. SYP-B2681]RTZ41498.1 amino acid ABC transporter permease [Candidimonas sp. SYP-B2681]